MLSETFPVFWEQGYQESVSLVTGQLASHGLLRLWLAFSPSLFFALSLWVCVWVNVCVYTHNTVYVCSFCKLDMANRLPTSANLPAHLFLIPGLSAPPGSSFHSWPDCFTTLSGLFFPPCSAVLPLWPQFVPAYQMNLHSYPISAWFWFSVSLFCVIRTR